MSTTTIRPSTVLPGLENRVRDHERVLKEFSLDEFPEPGRNIKFFLSDAPWGAVPANGHCDSLPSVLVAENYARIVFGDHGPYFEFSTSQIHWASFPWERSKDWRTAYYREFFPEWTKFQAVDKNAALSSAAPGTSWTEHGSVSTFFRVNGPHWTSVHEDGGTSPAGSSIRAEVSDDVFHLYGQLRDVSNKPNPPNSGKWFCNNNRDEGYADYRPTFVYAEADTQYIIAVDAETGRILGDNKYADEQRALLKEAGGSGTPGGGKKKNRWTKK